MKAGIASDTAKTTKNLAKQAAKQIAREPFEIAKTAAKQIGGVKESPRSLLGEQQKEEMEEKKIAPPEEQKVKETDLRRIQALEAEIKDIREQKKVEEQKRLQEEEIKKAQETQREESTPQVSSKPSRRLFGFGVGKTQAQKQQTRIEKPLPPSG